MLESAVEPNDVRIDHAGLVKDITEIANQISAMRARIKDNKEKLEAESRANKYLTAYILIEISKCFQNCDLLKQRTEVLYSSKFPGLEPMAGQYCGPMQFQIGPQSQSSIQNIVFRRGPTENNQN